MKLNDQVSATIDQWLKKYPAEQKRSAVVEALLLAQEQNGGWLNEAAMNAVADYLQLAYIEVYEVATFYDLFVLKPCGRHKISICTTVSCMLRGSDELVEYAKKRLGVELGESTKDGLFLLRESQCLAACGGAPCLQINDKAYHENMSVEKLASLIDELSEVDHA